MSLNFVQKHPFIRRALAALLAFAVLGGALLVRPAPAYADTLGDLQNKVNDLQKQYEDARKEYEAAKQDLSNTKNLRAAYRKQRQDVLTQIELITQQMDLLEQQIEAKELKIEEKQIDIERKQAEFDERWAGFKERMAAMQMMDDGGSIALLSSVTNLYELLTFSQTMEDIASKDQQICRELEQEREALEQERADLEQQKRELEDMYAELEKDEAELEDRRKELSDIIQKLDSQISQLDAEAEAAAASMSEADKQYKAALAALDAYIAEQNKKQEQNVPKLDTPIVWGIPIARYTRVSDRFGNTGTRNHGGVDIAAPAGTPIYAAADGVVSVSHTWDGHTKTGTESYGNYAVILHGTYDGKSYETRYAHMNATPIVRVGQQVTKGQVIGYVGTTGNSTGNHLHLELRINGVRYNPLSAIPLP